MRGDLFSFFKFFGWCAIHMYFHVHHSLSCVPLRQYRACAVDSLGLGITCLLGWDLYHCTMCTRHPNLVSFAFYAIPIFEEFLHFLVAIFKVFGFCLLRTSRWRTCEKVTAGMHAKMNYHTRCKHDFTKLPMLQTFGATGIQYKCR